MKDNEFDDIGKRLYDLEADPPKDGWNKIAPVINAPQQPGIIGALRKNGWKSMIILIPVSIYLLYSVRNGKQLESSSHVQGIVQEQAVEKITSLQTQKSIGDVPAERSTPKSFESIVTERDSIDRTIEKEMRNSKIVASEGTNNQIVQDEHREIVNNVDQLEAQANDIAMNGEIKNTDRHSEKSGSVILREAKVEERNETVLPVNLTTHHKEVIDSTNEAVKLLLVDEDNRIVPDTTSSREIATREQKKPFQGAWRVTASIVPHYLLEAARPVVNDDVFVTNIDKSGSPTRIDIGFALGAGKAITPNFYIDGQLSYTEMEQHISFSYATGKVDTLLAVQLPDQTVRVTPVYEVNNREISSKFSYGGLRLGGTYYFWSTPRRRFNINAAAGAHYLISSYVTEKTGGTATSLSNENLNTINYSVMVGVGYNLNLNKGWELMINPALNYYLRKVKDEGLPYNLNQQSFGLNIMLSKTLGN